MKVQGSIALVTGANGGIGRALVDELIHRGAAKVYVGMRDPSSFATSFADHSRLVALPLDVTRSDQIANAATAAADVTLLVNNAGFLGGRGPLSADDLARARQEMEVNYFGPLAIAQAFKETPALKGGALVNILSFVALVTIPQEGTYSASKSAALALTRSLRAELKPRGTQVLAVLPVQVDTPLGKSLPEPKLGRMRRGSRCRDRGSRRVERRAIVRGACRGLRESIGKFLRVMPLPACMSGILGVARAAKSERRRAGNARCRQRPSEFGATRQRWRSADRHSGRRRFDGAGDDHRERSDPPLHPRSLAREQRRLRLQNRWSGHTARRAPHRRLADAPGAVGSRPGDRH